MMETLSRVAILLAALVFGAVLISGKAEVNLAHKHKIKHTPAYTLQWSGNVAHVYLTSEIVEPSKYHTLFHLINTHEGTIVMHLAGFGGRADTLNQFIVSINTSKAHVITKTEGYVASAHAVLALAGDELIISPNSIFLFHKATVGRPTTEPDPVEATCRNQQGKFDRGVDAYTKCKTDLRAIMKSYDDTITRVINKYLTINEQIDFLLGYDVLVPGTTIKARVEAAHL